MTTDRPKTKGQLMQELSALKKKVAQMEKAGESPRESVGHFHSLHKRGQETITQANEDWERTFDAVPDLIAILDKKHRIVRVNKAMAARMGVRPEECVGLTCYHEVHGMDSPPAFCPHKQLLEDGREHTLEAHEDRLGGDFLVSVSPLRSPKGELIGSVHIARDITEQKRAQEILAEREKQYRTLVEAAARAGEALIVTQTVGEREGVLVFANGLATALTGYGAEEYNHVSWLDAIHADHRPAAYDRYRERIAGVDTPGVFEIPIRTKGGDALLLAISASRTEFQGRPAVVSFFRDIRAQKEAEDALKRSEAESLRLAKENETIAEIGRIISSNLNLEEVYKSFSEKVRELIPYDRVTINLINKDGTTLVNRYVEGESVPGRNAGDIFPLAGTLTAAIIQSRKGFLFGRPEEDEALSKYPGLAPEMDAGCRSFLSVPLIARNQPIGGLHFRSKKVRAYREKDLKLAEGIAGQIAGAIANANLFADLKSAEAVLKESEERSRVLGRENAIMAEIGQIVCSSLDMRSVYERFAEAARKLIPFDRITVNILSDRGKAFTIPYALGMAVPDRREGEAIPIKGTAVEEVLRTGSGIFIGEGDINDFLSRFPGISPLVKAGLSSMLFVPLTSEGRLIGVLSLQSAGGRSYSQPDLKQAEKIGAQIAGAVANMELYKQRRLMEDELLASEERYRRLVEQSPLMITVQRQKKYVYLNPAAVKALGASKPEELIGRSIYEVLHPDFWEAANERIGLIGQGKTVPPMEQKVIRLDGTILDVEVTHVQALYQNEPVVLGMARDITEQKKTEKERAAFQGQLQQAQKMEAIGTLAGGIAHDFNNILAAILGYAELASFKAPEDSEVKENLEQCLHAVHRATDLVKQILAFSRQGKQERRPTDIRPIVREGLKFLRASLPATIHIRENIQGNLGLIEADPTQVHQVLMNLGTNAAHAMAEKGGVLEVHLTRLDLTPENASAYPEMGAGTYLILRISDTGHGMSSEVQRRIFDPYFTTKKVGEGTGLGLAVVHGIVKSYGGAITVTSEPGKGSVFEVFFPGVYTPKAAPITEKIEPLPLGGQERILFVDDENAIVEIARGILGHLGYEVEVRTSSIEAREMFRANPDRFDLVITDMTMPNMTGDRLAQEILSIRPGIPIILCTGFSEYITEERAKALGIQEFVMKPLVMKDLAVVIRRALDRKKKKQR